jgi:hypothetical protein
MEPDEEGSGAGKCGGSISMPSWTQDQVCVGSYKVPAFLQPHEEKAASAQVT